MRSHVHTDIVWAISTVAVVVVGVKFGQWVGAKLATAGMPGIGAAIGGAFNLGVH